MQMFGTTFLRCTTDADFEPVTLEEAKLYCRIDTGSEEDSLLRQGSTPSARRGVFSVLRNGHGALKGSSFLAQCFPFLLHLALPVCPYLWMENLWRHPCTPSPLAAMAEMRRPFWPRLLLCTDFRHGGVLTLY